MERRDPLRHTTTIRDLDSEAADAAQFDVPILLTGERGVGKQTLARLIHQRTRGASAPLIVLDCSETPDAMFESGWVYPPAAAAPPAPPEGWLVSARGGTILLSNLEKMTPAKQAALYRYLDARHAAATARTGHPSSSTDVRLITCGDSGLFSKVKTGAFRSDLFYRLNTVHLYIRAVRERRDDVPVLVRQFLREAAEARQRPVPTVSAKAMARLAEYSWPGNVSELKAFAEDFVTHQRGDVIVTRMLPARMLLDTIGLGVCRDLATASLRALNGRRPRIGARPGSSN